MTRAVSSRAMHLSLNYALTAYFGDLPYPLGRGICLAGDSFD
jgi:hypothetical protein